MASGKINGGAYSGGYDYFMTWSSVSRGSESNSSDVTLNWIMKKKVSGTYYNAYNTTSSTNITLNINGSTQTTNAPFDMRYDENGAERVLASYTVNVPHNSDGTKSITVSGLHATGLGGSGWGTVSISDTTITLDTIPRAPSYNSIDATSILERSVYLSSSVETHGLEITGGGWDLSTNGGSNWTYYDGGVTGRSITGLTPGTQYWYRGYCVTAGGDINSSWQTFTTLNRRVNITYFNVSQINETSVRFNYSADAGCDWAWYSIDGGSTWANLDNSNIVSGLSAGTLYAFKLRLRRTDSQLTTDSDTYWQETINYPYISQSQNFTIGNNILFNLYNPLGREITIYVIGNDNSTINTATRSTSGDMSIGNTAQEIDSQYASIPNSNKGTYKVRLVVPSLNYRDTTFNGAEYSTNINDCSPLFSYFEFEDVNQTTIALTGNNQNIISRYSNMQVTIPIAYKATAQKYATMSKYSFVCGNKQANINYSSSESVNGTINEASSGTFTVYAIDSRQNSTPISRVANEVIDYNDLVKGNISISRQNGVGEITNLTISGTVHLIDFGEVINSIKTSKYRYKIANDSTWSNYTNITLTVDNEGNFSFNQNIQGDTNDGFDASNAYNIEVLVEDELSSITFKINLGSGIPNIALHKNGVGIMGKYNTLVGGKFQIDGKRIYIPEVIYNGAGQTGDITLSQSTSNYSTLEIYSTDYFGNSYVTKVSANDNNFIINTANYNASYGSYYYGMIKYSIGDTKLTHKYNAGIVIYTDGTRTYKNNDSYTNVSVYKVVGYREI